MQIKVKSVIHKNENIINLPEYKILTFWDKIDEIGVWNWSKKYPVKEPELEQLQMVIIGN